MNGIYNECMYVCICVGVSGFFYSFSYVCEIYSCKHLFWDHFLIHTHTFLLNHFESKGFFLHKTLFGTVVPRTFSLLYNCSIFTSLKLNNGVRL